MRFDSTFSEIAKAKTCSSAPTLGSLNPLNPPTPPIHPASLSVLSCLIEDSSGDTDHKPSSYRRPSGAGAEQSRPSSVLRKIRRGGRNGGSETLACASLWTSS